jgi:hypothetical protein
MLDENETAAQSSFRYGFREAENRLNAPLFATRALFLSEVHSSIGVQGRLAIGICRPDVFQKVKTRSDGN